MANNKIPPSEKIRKEIKDLLKGIGVEENGNIFSQLMEKAKLLIVEELLEKEVEEFLERKYYQRNKEISEKRGYRNGYEKNRINTPEGTLTLEIPQVRDTEEPFKSRIKKFFKTNTDILEKLATEMYVRGLSTRDIEEALYSATGDRVLSKSKVSQVTDILWQEYQDFITRDLSIYDIVYLIIDAVYESIRPYIKSEEAILVAYGITIDGKKVLLHMELGNKESYEFCKEFLRDMVKRGLNTPISITSDGAPGLVKAIEEIFPKSLRIRCWVHKMRNLSNKVPKEIWLKIKAEVEVIRNSLNYEEGKKRLVECAEKYRDEYPSFVKCLLEDSEALLNVLKLPYRHRISVRSSNLIERVFVEERRRTKIIPQFLMERSCLKLVFSVLWRASYRWQRIPVAEYEKKQIEELREQLGIDRERINLKKEKVSK